VVSIRLFVFNELMDVNPLVNIPGQGESLRLRLRSGLRQQRSGALRRVFIPGLKPGASTGSFAFAQDQSGFVSGKKNFALFRASLLLRRSYFA
jgi:hypothetical protein